MLNQKEELIGIITKFAESGWNAIDTPSKNWLKNEDAVDMSKAAAQELIEAIRTADKACGSCGCDYDALYKKALMLLEALY